MPFVSADDYYKKDYVCVIAEFLKALDKLNNWVMGQVG